MTEPEPFLIGGGDMGARMRAHDWSTSPLGHPSTWPRSLGSTVGLMLGSKFPMFVAWGSKLGFLYNDAYAEILGDKHPEALGRSFEAIWSEIWADILPFVETALSGQAVWFENLPFTMHRRGYDEATFFTFSYSPAFGDDGQVVGMFCACTETTRQVEADRRRSFRLALDERLRSLDDPDAIMMSAITLLGEHLGVERAGYGQVHPDDATIRLSHGYAKGVDPLEGDHPLDGFGGDGIARQRRGETEVRNDVLSEPGDDAASWEAIDTRALVSVPLVRDGRLRALLYVNAREPRRWSAEDVALVEDVAGRTWATLDRARAEADLRELAETLERRVQERTRERDRVWHLSRDMIGVADPHGVWHSANPAWSRILGWPIERIVGHTLAWLEHPDDAVAAFATAIERSGGAATFEFEGRLRREDGGYRTIHWTAVRDEGQFYCVGRDVTQERQRAASLRLFENIVESATAPICAFDTEFRLIAFNEAHNDEFFRVQGFRTRIGDVFPDLFVPEQRPVMRALMTRALTGEAFTVTEEFGNPEIGKPCWVLTYSPLRDEDGLVVGAFHYAQDISARVLAEAELSRLQDVLRQSQKMEAVGQLTGGLAHDFNNLLAGISGSLELMQARMAQGRIAEVDKYMVGAQGAAKRAAALTHRLLAFSRRQTLDPKPTDVNRLVQGMEDLLSRTVGPSIRVETVASGGLWPTLVDPNQLENALLNLCINARDAMPDGGTLTIETGNRWLDERAARERDLPPGQYVAMCVSDNGTGMSPDVVERAFDPFFTTKPLGVGTGLGLSMIYGFARQSGGQVRIYSEVGEGTMVCVYLPRHHVAAAVEEEAASPSGPLQAEAGETVLVIDDEPLVRMLVVDVLEDLGYTALEAGDGPQGMAILRTGVHLDLLITDVGLPNGMNGRQVADAARQLRPDLKVLFITGYAENAVLSHGHLDPGMQVVTKPFDTSRLAERIRTMVGSGG